MSEAWRWVMSFVAAYLVGSIPVGLMLARARGVDIRLHGSGNIGATNVWRVLGAKLGATCFALDVLKGAAPVALLGWWNGVLGARDITTTEALLWFGVGAAAIVGHMHSVWIGFRGGKGVATGLGALLAMWPLMTVAAAGALLVWIACARLTRYVSVSSCVAALSMPPLTALTYAMGLAGAGETPRERVAQGWPVLAVAAALAALVIWKHRANLARLAAGTESRIGGSRTRAASADSRTGGAA